MNIVFRESVVECSRKNGIEDGARERECYVEEGADSTDDGGCQATQPGEQGEEADENLEDSGGQGDDVGNKHPLRCRFVGRQTTTELWAEELVDAGVVQAPNFDRVEPELVCMGRAKGDIVSSICSKVSSTIVEQRDMVEVIYIKGFLDCSRSFADYGIGQRVFRKTEISGIDDDAAGICTEKIEIVEGRVRLVGASKADNDQADE